MGRNRPRATAGCAAAALSVACLALTACGGEPRAPQLLDEQRGTYRGVGIGATPREVRRVFGARPLANFYREPITPLKREYRDIGAPTYLDLPCKPGALRAALLRYEYVSFLFCDGRVYALLVADDPAETTRGVGIGDELDDVRKSYPRLRCDRAPIGEAGPTYPYCIGRVAGRRWTIRFGRDPLASIALSTSKMQ